MVEAIVAAIAFYAGFKARGYLDRILTNVAIRILVSETGKAKVIAMFEAGYRKLAAERSK